MLRITQSSSACAATSGNSSETHSPLWPCWLELPGRAQQLRAGDAARPADALPSADGELGLVVERVDVRRRPVHAEEDHALGPGREVRGLRRQRRVLRARARPPSTTARRTPGSRTRRRRPSTGRDARRPSGIHRIDPPRCGTFAVDVNPDSGTRRRRAEPGRTPSRPSRAGSVASVRAPRIRGGTARARSRSSARRRPARGRADTRRSTRRASSPSTARTRSASGLGLPDHERAVQQVKRLGRAGRRRPLARHQARVGEVEQGERLEHLVADHGQVDRPMRVRGVQAARRGRRTPAPRPHAPPAEPTGGPVASRPLTTAGHRARPRRPAGACSSARRGRCRGRPRSSGRRGPSRARRPG